MMEKSVPFIVGTRDEVEHTLEELAKKREEIIASLGTQEPRQLAAGEQVVV